MDRGRFSHEQGSARTPQPCDPRWADYERRKAAWQEANPKATPEQYEAAVRAIADECGV